MDKYLKAIKQNVCSICVDSNEKGGCTLNEKETCAVELYLPQIIEIVNSLESDDIKEYFNKLHDVVCTKCREKEEGSCYLREDANCSLDRHFPIIVDVIKKVNKEVI
jgi:hypothetical protein